MQLRVERTLRLPGEVQMALDASLAATPAPDVVLRFFLWEGPCVTVGRSFPQDQALAAAQLFPGASLVRRPTGGGTVYHADQASLSLVWPRGYTALGSLRESYCLIHGCVAAALGAGYRLASPEEATTGPNCSDTPVRGDLLDLSGRKVAGGGQWISSHTILYQGHIWLEPSESLHARIADELARRLGLDLAFADTPQERVEDAYARAGSYLISPAADASGESNRPGERSGSR